MANATIKELKQQLCRRASRAIVGGFRPPTDPLASRLGKVNVAATEEKNRRVGAGGHEWCLS